MRVLLQASVGSSTFGGANRVGSHSIKPNRNYIVRRSGGNIVVRTPRGKRVARSSGVLRVTGPEGLVTVAGKGVYRDEIDYRPGLSGGVTAVNRVELENYIRGVVPNESPGSWPIEALKAQAVAARSYALGTNSGNAVFDHYDTTASQVYGGYSTEQAKTNRAVAQTRGEVLRYRGEVIVAYFHSTSGGYTENNENIFTGSEPLPYIRGVPDPWDKASPYHHWRVSYSARGLGNALGVGRLRSVRVIKRGVSPRIVLAKFRGSNGGVRLDGWNGIRARLGLRDAPSTFKKITASGSTRERGGRRRGVAGAHARHRRIGRTRPGGRQDRGRAAHAHELGARRHWPPPALGQVPRGARRKGLLPRDRRRRCRAHRPRTLAACRYPGSTPIGRPLACGGCSRRSRCRRRARGTGSKSRPVSTRGSCVSRAAA